MARCQALPLADMLDLQVLGNIALQTTTADVLWRDAS
jgi:hypothetical protein